MNKDKKKLILFIGALVLIIAMYFGITASYKAVRRQYYPTIDEASADLFHKMKVGNYMDVTEAKLLEVGYIDVSKPLPKNSEKLATIVDGIAKKHDKRLECSVKTPMAILSLVLQ